MHIEDIKESHLAADAGFDHSIEIPSTLCNSLQKNYQELKYSFNSSLIDRILDSFWMINKKTAAMSRAETSS
ncbi:CLUMA_CG017882, isoform A [Clunio marinus]|uniref:CLUMA_CG017882, isoform A n=1 Tax=Clunio marinus TaxID=568069 RepID=A0A1J1IXA3_9DIPT|nr:CLUMA_CG017882, isoform A [Clunio marinus]